LEHSLETLRESSELQRQIGQFVLGSRVAAAQQMVQVVLEKEKRGNQTKRKAIASSYKHGKEQKEEQEESSNNNSNKNNNNNNSNSSSSMQVGRNKKRACIHPKDKTFVLTKEKVAAWNLLENCERMTKMFDDIQRIQDTLEAVIVDAIKDSSAEKDDTEGKEGKEDKNSGEGMKQPEEDHQPGKIGT